jgi:hypothetical protein
VSVVDKTYTEDDQPLWGIEDANMTVMNLDPLWGLIDPELANHVNLSTIRSDHLYLPAGSSSIISGSGGTVYIPASTMPTSLWSRVYDTSDTLNTGTDYTGASNLALTKKWDNLTQTAGGTAYMMNLMWMDYAANALTGSRGQLTTHLLPPNLAPALKTSHRMAKRADDDDPPSHSVPVHIYRRTIRYRWVYGIPAFLTVVVVGLISLAALITILIGRSSPRRIEHFLWNLSAGRILTSFLYPGSSHMQTETKEWIRNVGSADVTITRSWGAHGGLGPQSAATGGGGFAGVATNYERVAQREEEDSSEGVEIKDAVVAQTKPLAGHGNANAGASPEVQYRSNADVNQDYVVHR